MDKYHKTRPIRDQIEAARMRCAEPHPRDILKREHYEGRPPDVALEKWGAELEAQVWRELARHEKHTRHAQHMKGPGQSNTVERTGPDLDRD